MSVIIPTSAKGDKADEVQPSLFFTVMIPAEIETDVRNMRSSELRDITENGAVLCDV